MARHTAKIVPIRKASVGPVEDNIPMPPAGNGRGRERIYPLDTMKVKQSFTVPKSMRSSVGMSVHTYQKRHPGKIFTTRLVGEFVRVWRIK